MRLRTITLLLTSMALTIVHPIYPQRMVLPVPNSTEWSAIDTLMNDAIRANQLPGGVVVIGHNSRIVFHKAYGNRAVDPKVEAMTEDTIFDMASLTKCLVTATSIMQLHEAGKLNLEDPVARYLPDFATDGKEKVTIAQLLTHYSGLPPDVDLQSPWHTKAEGTALALNSPLDNPPGTRFVYSDINFIVLGLLVEKLSGDTLDHYAQTQIFQPLGMTHTRYLPPSDWIPNIAPTAHNDDGPLADDKLLRGTVHDPTTRRMGGVAGQAGVFSTADDIALYAQALLDKLLQNTGPFPLSQAELQLMVDDHHPTTASNTQTIFTPDGQPTKGVALHAYGWDINTAYSRPRGEIFHIGSFGHTGFTGTSLWLDPASNTYVILLANAIHPRGRPPISTLRGKLATAAAHAISRQALDATLSKSDLANAIAKLAPPVKNTAILPGIDVLETSSYLDLQLLLQKHNGHLNFGLLTNQTGLDRNGHRTIDALFHQAPAGSKLTTLFSPEHGILGAEDREDIASSRDKATGLPVVSLYSSIAARHPRHEDLANLDAVFIDLQDAGVRFYTYEAQMAYFLEVAAREEREFHHRLDVVILDRPSLIAPTRVAGPLSDPGHPAYTNYMPMPVQHGMTIGELAQFFNTENHLNAPLTVIKVENYKRNLWFDQTNLPWINPSPNLQSLAAATLYPGTAFLETTNVSVGRGTDHPFEQFGAPWIDSAPLLAFLNARHISAVRFEAITFTPAKPYPYAGQLCQGIRITSTDRDHLDAPELGLELLSAFHKLYPQFQLEKANQIILVNQATMDALLANKDPREIAAQWQPALDAFKQTRAKYLLYQ